MINNLEGISFEAVVNNSQVTYDTFRKTLVPDYRRVWTDIIIAWFFLLLPFFISPFIPGSLLLLLLFLCPIYFGYILAFLHLFVHEAAHFNLHRSKRINEKLAMYFICPLFGIDLKKYRKTHWTHHLHLAEPEDAEVSYFNALTFPFFVQTLSGIHAWKIIRRRKKNNLQKKYAENFNGWLVLFFSLFHLTIILIAWLTGSWPLVLSWILGIAIFFPFFATIRQILEHRDELAGNDFHYYRQSRKRISRLFGDDFLSRTFGAAGFNMHMIHHWDPQISYTRLRDVLLFLKESSLTSAFVNNSQTSYKKVFYRLLHA